MPSAAAQRGYRHWTVIGVGAVINFVLSHLFVFTKQEEIVPVV